MKIKFRLNSKDEAPADLRHLYSEHNGAWVLDVDGAVDMARLDEFRANNLALLKERDDLKQRFDGIDPDQVRNLVEEKRRLEEENALAGGHRGQVEKVFAGRMKTLREELEKQMAGLATERDSLKSRLAGIQIDQAVTAEATRRGLRPTAIPDITSRARHAFRLVDGIAQAFDSGAGIPRCGKDGVTPMTVQEWIDAQVSEAPHLFDANVGFGAIGAAPSGGRGFEPPMRNPFKKSTWNLTEQMKLTKRDPGLAARLKAAAEAS